MRPRRPSSPTDPSRARTPHRRRPARPDGQRAGHVLRRVEHRRRSRSHAPAERPRHRRVQRQPHRLDRTPHAGRRHGASPDRRPRGRAGTGLLHHVHSAPTQVLPAEAPGSRPRRHRPARGRTGRRRRTADLDDHHDQRRGRLSTCRQRHRPGRRGARDAAPSPAVPGRSRSPRRCGVTAASSGATTRAK